MSFTCSPVATGRFPFRCMTDSGVRPWLAEFLEECLSLGQLGKPARPQRHDQQGADAADDDGCHCAEPRSDESGFELSKVIGCAGAKRIDRADAPAHRIGSFKLYERDA